MTADRIAYGDRFELARRVNSWDVYRWLGWSLYWDAERNEGKLYDPSGVFIRETFGVFLGFETLATEAVKRQGVTP